MKQYSLLAIFTLCVVMAINAQQADTLVVQYFKNNPYAYEDAGKHQGIEVEIIEAYVNWLQTKKKKNTEIKYKAVENFEVFFNGIKTGSKNSIGLGSVTIGKEKALSVDFTKAYMKNVAVCITSGNAPDIKSKTADEIVKTLGNMIALSMENTTLSNYCLDIKKQYVNDLKVMYLPNETKILDEISKNVLYFGYVDAVSFWYYLKNNPRKFLKSQKALSQSKEELGFILPKGSAHKVLFDEFFAGPEGFKKSPAYKAILEKYLGAFMAQQVGVN
jgi:ABC-type amino acid transport substrate-binding protein